MIAPWKPRPGIATDQMQAEREAPDVIERAAAEMASTFSKLRPIDSPVKDEEAAWEESMKAAIRVVLEDFRSHIGAGSVCQSVLRDYAASIGIKLAPDQPANPEDWPLQSEAG